MCLTVVEVPTNDVAGRFIPCWKMLERSYGHYHTPFQYTYVPADGLLRPKHLSKKQEFYHHDRIYGGLIHAYMEQHHTVYGVGMHYLAYAFGVKAYGRKDLACQALYIPGADTTDDYHERIDTIDRWVESGRTPTVKAIVKQFPKLERIFK